MRYLRQLQFALFALISGLVVAGASAQPPNKAKQQLRKQLMEAQKKAEAQKKRDEERRKAEQLKIELGKKETGTKPEPFTPKRIGDPVAVAGVIDREIDAKLKADSITPGERSTDAEFLRRAYLDLTGIIPTAAKARQFLDDRSPNKREKLIDELLASSNFGKHASDIWMGLLVTRTSDQRRISFDPLRTWLAEQFNANTPWDKIAADLIAAEGTQEKNPAVTYYLSNNTVDKMTDSVSKLFLGVSIQCAQCHDHKFEDWKQTEYWSLAQFFMRVQVGGLQQNGTPSIEEVKNPNRRRIPLPEDAKAMPVRYLRDATPVKLPDDGAIRPTLAKWVTSPTNPYFAKAMVNRVWAQLFGTGLVHPVDDMGPNAIASHPDLLKLLAGNFAADKFDLKNLVRAIVLSKAYQRSGKPTGGEGDDDPQRFARMAVKVMTPEQLYDSTFSIVGSAINPQARARMAANVPKGPLADPRERFVNFFLAGQEMANTTEYEVGIPQALKLMNSRQFGNPTTVRRLLGTKKDKDAIEELYLATLSRRPTEEEMKSMTAYVTSAPTPMEGYGDVLWALLNCSEYTLVR
jgi:hypothetical protein